MKSDEILKNVKINDEECELCTLHHIAQDKIPDKIICPHCGQELDIDYISKDDLEVVGEDNSTESQELYKWLVFQCNKCTEYMALIPTAIKYNANHDIFYTGGKHYLIKKIDNIKDAIMPDIEQYTRRIKAGEDLQSWNLATWIDYKIEAVVAKYLYENGFKK